jgi:membrane-bound ClpP family serine protease
MDLGYDYVPAWHVFSFNIIKKPFISSLWYVLLVYTIFNPSDFLPTAIGIVLLILSFTGARFFLAILSPIPCIAEIIVSRNIFIDAKPTIILIVGIIWLVIYTIAMVVWHHLAIGKYEILPVSNKMVKK